jgi:hypothetical protein
VRPSAGLPLSVGQASLAVRLVIAVVFLLAAGVAIAGGVLMSVIPVARVMAVLLVVPVGLIGILAAAFVLAPHSRYGVWLDHFVPALRRPAVAVATAIALWAAAFLLTWIW